MTYEIEQDFKLWHARRRTWPDQSGSPGKVQIASDLIAFYPQAIHRQQPYVILLDPATAF
jgi:hypothetical protein